MVKCEYYMTRNDGVILVKSYSDQNKYIKQVETGIEYDEAIDIGYYDKDRYLPINYCYIETDTEIEKLEEDYL